LVPRPRVAGVSRLLPVLAGTAGGERTRPRYGEPLAGAAAHGMLPLAARWACGGTRRHAADAAAAAAAQAAAMQQAQALAALARALARQAQAAAQAARARAQPAREAGAAGG